jgi:hypothetical protein
MFICVLVTITFVTSHLSVPKFTARLSRIDFNKGWRLYLVILKYIYHKLYAVILINSMGPEKLEDSQPVKFLAFHGIQVFIIAFTRAPPPPYPTQSQMNQDYISSFTTMYFNHLTPNGHFSGRTAPLTYRCCIFLFIQQICVLNILNMLHNLRVFLFKMPFIL